MTDLIGALVDHDDVELLARGGGRSYGDVALLTGGHVVLTRRLDRILHFDPNTGDIVVEPGVTFRDLLEVFLSRGFLVPVTPGTSFATIGGAVANDVHGKNHDRQGSFGNHVQWLNLLLPDGSIARCSAEERSDLFCATIGGVGLTGIILAIAFRMVRAPSNAVVVNEQRIADLDEFLEKLTASRCSAHFSVGWIDALARRGALGRGIFETGALAGRGLPATPASVRATAVGLPAFTMNRVTIAAFNKIYRRRVPKDARERVISLSRFLYPLDSLVNWNRIYGKRGFRQFQCVIPDAGARQCLRRILEDVGREGSLPCLAVIKTLGGEGQGLLSFPIRGVTLALDLPCRPGLDDIMAHLERLTLDYGGRVYLAKDSCISAAGFAQMYPKLPQFRRILETVDPRRRMNSDMARRLRIREAT
jgi:decaprenylphospho-beta-D-ribofuranose 2-oxidase